MTIWFVSILPTWCPTVPGPLSTPRKSIQPLDTVWSVWPTDIDTHFCEAAIEWHPTVCCNDCMCPMGGTCFCTGLCESYNGSCEIWTDTLLLSLLLSLSFSLDHTRPVPSSVTRCYYFDEVFLLHICAPTQTLCSPTLVQGSWLALWFIGSNYTSWSQAVSAPDLVVFCRFHLLVINPAGWRPCPVWSAAFSPEDIDLTVFIKKILDILVHLLCPHPPPPTSGLNIHLFSYWRRPSYIHLACNQFLWHKR